MPVEQTEDRKWRVLRRCIDEDFKTSAVKPRPALQEGEIVVGKPFINFYGEFLSCRAENGFHYNLRMKDAEEVEG